MAPGCFSQSAKDSSTDTNSTATSKLASTTSTINDHDEKSMETIINESDDGTNLVVVNGGDLNNNNQIPLPPSPPPPQPLSFRPDHAAQEDDEEDDESDDSEDEDDDEQEEQEEQEDGQIKEMGKDLLKNTSPMCVSRAKRQVNTLFVDTVDSFEILEQTIIKQKRLAKLKNTDLRRKVLLKRTFDLVCEIMDSENGFNEDDEEEEDVKTNVAKSVLAKIAPAPSKIDASSSKAKPDENEQVEDDDDEDDDDEDDEDEDEELHSLELELHDHTKMVTADMSDDEDEDEDEDDDERHVTVVKLVDVAVTEPTCQVPRHHQRNHLKRRSSSSGEDDDDEEDHDYYEYSMNHLNDQQLNYRRTPVAVAVAETSDLNMYIDHSKDTRSALVVDEAAKVTTTTITQEHRSNHPRKRVKI